MGIRQLLFVTYRDENVLEGFSYAVDLAKAMGEDIALLLVKKRRPLMEKFEGVMTAIAFAEVGEHETARKQLAGPPDAIGRSTRSLRGVLEKSAREGVEVRVEQTEEEVIPAIRSYLESHKGIDKVVLSPSITEAGRFRAKELSRLVRMSSRPIVTMTKRAATAGA